MSGQPGIPAPVGKPRSLLLVPVETNDYQYGWLLALNKVSTRDERPWGTTALEPRPSEHEFGTIEGSLLKSAGILLATHARNAQLFLQKEAMMIGVIRALINAIDAKDSYTLGHSDRVASMAKRLARQLGHDEAACERIFLTGLLHDIGKIGVPDSVLLKPGKLTEEEFELIKKHPDIGYNILKHVDQLDYVLDGVLHHHEAYDGSGYPHRLAGEEIPLVARIIAVADAYDAMTSCRPYRQAMPKEKAEFILRQNAGKMWDATVVAAFDDATDDIHAICQSERADRGLGGSDAQQSIHDVVRTSGDLVGKAVTASHQFQRAPATSPTSN
ncbi:MAG: hypothetical protein B7Z55_00745 [Planctomycetales bacterium 12-60-4]|nr:MAG: hypothetical protein B7Z55_00745 [Planctomycetales bacterium 12-60-4]